MLVILFASLLGCTANTVHNPTVVVTGATGATGVLLYQQLKATGMYNVRASIRNVAKAKSVLGCTACDESEGVFVGDIMKKETMDAVMRGADILMITTGAVLHCHGIVPFPPFGGCNYSTGGEPKLVNWIGTRNQVEAFAQGGGDPKAKHIVYLSGLLTQTPDNFLDRFGNGQCMFYNLVAEADIMQAAVPFTIVKAGALGTGPPGKHKLVTGHSGDAGGVTPRADVARVMVEAIRNKNVSVGLRFDLTTRACLFCKPTTDIVNDVLKAAMNPWDPRNQEDAEITV